MKDIWLMIFVAAILSGGGLLIGHTAGYKQASNDLSELCQEEPPTYKIIESPKLRAHNGPAYWQFLIHEHDNGKINKRYELVYTKQGYIDTYKDYGVPLPKMEGEEWK